MAGGGALGEGGGRSPVFLGGDPLNSGGEGAPRREEEGGGRGGGAAGAARARTRGRSPYGSERLREGSGGNAPACAPPRLRIASGSWGRGGGVGDPDGGGGDSAHAPAPQGGVAGGWGGGGHLLSRRGVRGCVGPPLPLPPFPLCSAVFVAGFRGVPAPVASGGVSRVKGTKRFGEKNGGFTCIDP